jgi:hypothetical protein
MIQIHIKRKLVDGKVIRILECKDARMLMDFVRSHYLKRTGWRIKEELCRVGWFKKRYKIVIRKS